MICSFCLSLTINHFVVLILTTINFYTRTTLFIIFGLEICILLYLLVTRYNFIVESSHNDIRYAVAVFTDMIESSLTAKLRKSVLIMIAIILLVYLSYLVMLNVGEIFNNMDVVVNWNRWSVDWANNQFPKITWHYPQLLPTNLSLSYVFINDSTIQFFARSIMPLFPMILLLMFLDLWLKNKHEGYVLGAFLTILMLMLFNTVNQMIDGLADTPVACMGFAGFYLLLENSCKDDDFDRRTNVFLGSIMIAGAASTKQAALFLLMLYPLFVMLEKDINGYQDKSLRKQLFMVLALPFLLILPWYLYVERNIWLGINVSEINDVTGIVHNNRGAWQRVGHSINILLLSVQNSPFIYNLMQKITLGLAGGIKSGILLYTIIVTGILGCIGSKQYQKYVFGIVIPFALIWIFFFSYDLRNFSLVAPFLATTSAMGFYNRASFDKQKLTYLLYFCIPIILIAGNGYFKKERLIEMQQIKQKRIGDPILNELLYKLKDKMSKDQVILSNYHILKYLPGLENNRKDFITSNDIQDAKVRYVLLMTGYDYNNKLDAINKLIASNKIKQLQNSQYFILYEMVGR